MTILAGTLPDVEVPDYELRYYAALLALTAQLVRCAAAGIDTTSIAATLQAALAAGRLNETQAMTHYAALLAL